VRLGPAVAQRAGAQQETEGHAQGASAESQEEEKNAQEQKLRAKLQVSTATPLRIVVAVRDNNCMRSQIWACSEHCDALTPDPSATINGRIFSR
jgi:hypothetical protein